jgi:hypothetical protein
MGLPLVWARVHHVVGAQDDGHIGLAELAVDVFHLEHLVVGHLGLGQQHVHVARHAPGHRVDGVLDGDALLGELGGQFLHGMLGPRHGQAVAGHDDHGLGIAQHKGGVVGAAALDGCAAAAPPAAAVPASPPKPPRITLKNAAVHGLAHDVAQDRARAAHQRAGNDQHAVVQAEADARRRPARVAVEHGHHHRHVGAADGDDDQHAQHKGQRQQQPEVNAVAR